MHMARARPNAFVFDLPPEYRGMAKTIAEIRTQVADGRTAEVSLAEAIRYAIAFTHKHLTEVINPEDLDE